MTLKLTIPPSINNLYGHNRKGFTYITRKGKEWFEYSQWLAKTQLNEWVTITDNVVIDIMMFTAIRRDVDNIGKATLDLLGKYLKIIENDDQVCDLRIRKIKVDHKIDEQLTINIETVQ
jgi:Holliday junction resolvase RusA-like endonuclease